jgi:hypothetical protein
MRKFLERGMRGGDFTFAAWRGCALNKNDGDDWPSHLWNPIRLVSAVGATLVVALRA